MTKAVVLLSSGLDSTVNLYQALQVSQVVLALTFDYGQRAAPREIAFAQRTCAHLGVPHKVLDLKWFAEFTQTSLVAHDQSVPKASQVSIDDLGVSNQTAKAVWVPNRNGIFLNIAAGFAEGLGAKWVVPGFNIEEAATFADNTQGFLDAATASFKFSTASHIEAKCFTTDLNKTEIVRLGVKLKVNFEHIWPCYFGGEIACGECESCQRFSRAKENGLKPEKV